MFDTVNISRTCDACVHAVSSQSLLAHFQDLAENIERTSECEVYSQARPLYSFLNRGRKLQETYTLIRVILIGFTKMAQRKLEL